MTNTVMVVSRCAWTLFSFRGNLIRQLKAEGYHVIAVGDGSDGYGQRICTELGVSFVDVPVAARGFNPFVECLFVMRMLKTIRRYRPDIIHFFTIKPVVFGSIAAAIARVAVRVSTITGLGYAFTDASPVLKGIVTRLYRLALAFNHWVFFQNGEDQRLFEQTGIIRSGRSSVVAGSGVDLNRFQPMELEIREKAPFRLLFIGRLLRDKGIMELISAARVIRQSGMPVQIACLGAIDERNPSSLSEEELAAFVNEGIVTFHGHSDDVRPFVAQSHIVILPSYREGTPRVLLEAAAMARPLLASDVPGCREVVRDGLNGFLFEPKSAASIVQAIERIIADVPKLHRMASESRSLVEAVFDERRVIQTTLDKYALLLGDG